MRFPIHNARHKIRPALLGAALAASLAAAGPVLAADILTEQPPEPPMPPQQTNLLWSGPYAGLFASYGRLNGDVSPGTDIDGIDGVGFGAYGGYNYQFDNNWVAGFEGQIGGSHAENSFDGLDVEQGLEASLRARMGYAFDNSMLYGLAGLAGTRAEVSDGTGSDSNTHLGWVIGAGLETMLTDRVSARVEYDFSKYGSEQYSLGSSSPDVALSGHAIKVGVGLKF